MSQFGTCERGCSEQKLELVHAVNSDTLEAFSAESGVNTKAFRAVAEELVSRRPGADEYETAYRAVQHAARASLRSNPAPVPPIADWEEPAERATTWWCAECGGIDAPQPCLGICIWRPVDWVNANLYEQQRTRALAELDTEQSLRLLLRRIASVTPRPGQWEGNWRAVEIQVRQTLQACKDADESTTSSR